MATKKKGVSKAKSKSSAKKKKVSAGKKVKTAAKKKKTAKKISKKAVKKAAPKKAKKKTAKKRTAKKTKGSSRAKNTPLKIKNVPVEVTAEIDGEFIDMPENNAEKNEENEHPVKKVKFHEGENYFHSHGEVLFHQENQKVNNALSSRRNLAKSINSRGKRLNSRH